MNFKKFATRSLLTVAVAGAAFGLAACSNNSTSSSSSGSSSSSAKKEPLKIYTNGDSEAVEVVQKTLDDNGYKGNYKIETFGSSDFNTKLLTEGKNIKADLIMMSTFYVEGAQDKNNMFAKFDTPKDGVVKQADYQSPVLGNQGALIINTELLKKKNLPEPKSIKDLADPKYKDMISFPTPEGSTTAWLMEQALIEKYGESETKTILSGMIKNAGGKVTNSGSAPGKNVKAGEVAISYSLRVQGESFVKKGLPLKVVDPTEGNYMLTESVAMIDHGDKTNPEAKKAVELLATKSRKGMMDYYPPVLFKGETENSNEAVRGKLFSKTLTTDLLAEHIKLFNSAK